MAIIVSMCSRSTPTPGPPSTRALNLFREGGARLFQADLAQGLEPNAERADGAGDKGARMPACPRIWATHFARQPHAGQVDVADLVAEPEALQAEGVRAEGVGLDDFGAGLQILGVDRGDQSPAATGSARRSSG